MAGERPFGVTILAVLSGLAGVFLVLGGLLLVIGGSAAVGMDAAMGGSGVGAIVGAVTGVLAGILLVFGLINLVVAWGLWTGKGWAWWLTVIGGVLNLLSILALNILGAVIGAIVLWYMFKPHVKEFFGINVEFST